MPDDLRQADDDVYEAPGVASKMLVAAMGLIETLEVNQRAPLRSSAVVVIGFKAPCLPL